MSLTGSQMGDMEAAIASALGGECVGAADSHPYSQLQTSQRSELRQDDMRNQHPCDIDEGLLGSRCFALCLSVCSCSCVMCLR